MLPERAYNVALPPPAACCMRERRQASGQPTRLAVFSGFSSVRDAMTCRRCDIDADGIGDPTAIERNHLDGVEPIVVDGCTGHVSWGGRERINRMGADAA